MQCQYNNTIFKIQLIVLVLAFFFIVLTDCETIKIYVVL